MIKSYFDRFRKKRYNLFDIVGGALLIRCLTEDITSWAGMVYWFLFLVWVLCDVAAAEEDEYEITGTVESFEIDKGIMNDEQS